MDYSTSADAVRRHYDELGLGEWTRLTRDVAGRVSLEVHRQFLRRFIPPGSRVLEVGAGPGRFTLELAALNCRIVVTDLSDIQLQLNAEQLAGTPAEAHVERRELLDVCDTSRYHDGEFDAVLAYGGPLSYAFDQAEQALHGLLRVVRPAGVVVASVISWLGSWRHLLPAITSLAEQVGEDAHNATLRTGDLRHVIHNGHICQMFRWSDLETLIPAAGGILLDGSASNWASLSDPNTLARLEANPQRWQNFLTHEIAACSQPGTRDGGTHILFATHPNPPPSTCPRQDSNLRPKD